MIPLVPNRRATELNFADFCEKYWYISNLSTKRVLINGGNHYFIILGAIHENIADTNKQKCQFPSNKASRFLSSIINIFNSVIIIRTRIISTHRYMH